MTFFAVDAVQLQRIAAGARFVRFASAHRKTLARKMLIAKAMRAVVAAAVTNAACAGSGWRVCVRACSAGDSIASSASTAAMCCTPMGLAGRMQTGMEARLGAGMQQYDV